MIDNVINDPNPFEAIEDAISVCVLDHIPVMLDGPLNFVPVALNFLEGIHALLEKLFGLLGLYFRLSAYLRSECDGRTECKGDKLFH